MARLWQQFRQSRLRRSGGDSTGIQLALPQQIATKNGVNDIGQLLGLRFGLLAADQIAEEIHFSLPFQDRDRWSEGRHHAVVVGACRLCDERARQGL